MLIFDVNTSISQKFFISLILYLFYNVTLLKICTNTDINAKTLKYINNIIIMIKSEIYEKNEQIL